MDHAEVPSCADCRKWQYTKDWKRETRHGQWMERRGPSPCYRCPKGPEPFKNEPTRTTLLTLEYYYQCLADTGGLLPRDRRVVENNALIARIKEQAARARLDAMPLVMLASIGGTKGKK